LSGHGWSYGGFEIIGIPQEKLNVRNDE